jgi:ATP-binding cassette subfamily B protein
MRLYDPSSGSILVNGIDIREFDPVEYRARVGVVFQDFQLFAATVAENVALDRVGQADSCLGQIEASLARSGFAQRLSKMPQGVGTPLTREFEESGENLSGGEAQKLAIARVLFKPVALSILDEPSSALDPVSEYELNATLQEQTKGSTVVYISHRLSSTRLANRVVLLENGRVAEEGTHEELMARGGAYERMFTLQAARYLPPGCR